MKHLTTTTSISKCGRVTVVAAPFGFGPRRSADYLASTLELELEPWHSMPAGDVRVQTEVCWNFGATSLRIDTHKVRTVAWIDCLGWGRGDLPAPAYHADLILHEVFFPPRRGVIANAPIISISPLCWPSRALPASTHRRHGPIVVSFGGIDTPFSTRAHRELMPAALLRALRQARDDARSDTEIVCLAPQNHVQRLTALVPGVHVAVATSSDVDGWLQRASVYVVQPGLYGPFEAFERGIPVVMTTPITYTQCLQARAYEAHGLLGRVPLGTELDQAAGPLDFRPDAEEAACFVRIDRCVNELMSHPDTRRRLTEWAAWAVRPDAVDPALTEKRAAHVQACRAYGPIPETYARRLRGSDTDGSGGAA